MHLRTERLVLREFTWDDLDAVYAYESDLVVVAHVCYGPTTIEQCRQDLTFHINHQTAQPRAFYHLALVLPPEEQPIGWCGLQIINPTHREGELGYALHRTYWGFGYATEAAQAMLQFGFDHLGLHRIVGTCHPDNRRSIRVLEKAGMTYEGRLREHKWCRDHWRDTNLYAMLDHEWQSRRTRSVRSEGLTDNSAVELSLRDNVIVIAPLVAPLTLDALLAQVTEDNLHREVDTGAATGNEAW